MKIVAVSGGFDPMHTGHIQYIEGAVELGDKVIVILSRDDQLVMKKGKYVIPYEVRKAVIEWGLNGRGEVVENIDNDHTARESIAYYMPDVFAKGGDTWDSDNLPEKNVCDELDIKVIFGVGGYDKPYSSSNFNV